MNVAIRSECLINEIAESHVLFELFTAINDNPLIDRLYRRYVRREDNEKTLMLLHSKVGIIHNEPLKNLLEKFARGIENSEYFFKKYGEYVPVRLVIGDMPYPLIEEEIPLEDYDNLEGDPFWLRPEYMIEKYG